MARANTLRAFDSFLRSTQKAAYCSQSAVASRVTAQLTALSNTLVACLNWRSSISNCAYRPQASATRAAARRRSLEPSASVSVARTHSSIAASTPARASPTFSYWGSSRQYTLFKWEAASSLPPLSSLGNVRCWRG